MEDIIIILAIIYLFSILVILPLSIHILCEGKENKIKLYFNNVIIIQMIFVFAFIMVSIW